MVGSSFETLPLFSWALYALSLFFLVISKYALMLSLYSPNILGSYVMNSREGVGAFITGYLLSAIVLYVFLRQSSAKLSKTPLWLSYVLTVYAFYQVAFYTLLLAVGLIEKESVSLPFLASIIILAYIPFIAVLYLSALQVDQRGN